MLVPWRPSTASVTASATARDTMISHWRICEKSKPITAIGVAFAAQEIKAVPALAHDVALDYVLTEKKAFDFRSS